MILSLPPARCPHCRAVIAGHRRREHLAAEERRDEAVADSRGARRTRPRQRCPIDVSGCVIHHDAALDGDPGLASEPTLA
jgi:hypothetical protein